MPLRTTLPIAHCTLQKHASLARAVPLSLAFSPFSWRSTTSTDARRRREQDDACHIVRALCARLTRSLGRDDVTQRGVRISPSE